jgi:hypothetical protein
MLVPQLADALPVIVVGLVVAAVVAVRRHGLGSRLVIGAATIAVVGVLAVSGFLMLTAPMVPDGSSGVWPL